VTLHELSYYSPTSPHTCARTLQFITEQMTPWLWPQSNSSWLFFFHSYKFKPVCFLILSSSKCKDGAFTCQPLFQLFLRNYLLATAGDRTPGYRGLYWTHCNHAQLLWFAINNTVPLKSHFLQSYWMWPPTIKHPSGIKKKTVIMNEYPKTRSSRKNEKQKQANNNKTNKKETTQRNHRITGYPKLEGTCKVHQVQLLGKRNI